jgi:hypothetical protein
MAAFCAAVLSIACGAPHSVDRPPDALNAAQSEKMLAVILEKGRDGDWLVARGYHTGDKIVTTATRTPISHAAMLDMGRQEVVESQAMGVHLTALRKFIDNSHRIILVRPIWSDRIPGSNARALEAARGYVGSKYDYWGALGIDNKKKFYCSELALQSYREFFDDKEEIPTVIEPDQLYLWGTVLYDSRPRNEW